jgi:hypothetical protein
MISGVNAVNWAMASRRLRRELLGAWDDWGAIGVACVVLALMLALFIGGWILPATRTLSDLRKTSDDRLLARPIVKRNALIAHAAKPLDEFRRNFPPASLILSITADLDHQAQEAGLNVAQADYHHSKDASGLERYDISLAARATYPQIRRFTAASLTHFPTLSLDGIILSRNSVSDPVLDAQFQYSVYLGAP